MSIALDFGISLLNEQNDLARRYGPSCRYLRYRCAALKSTASTSLLAPNQQLQRVSNNSTSGGRGPGAKSTRYTGGDEEFLMDNYSQPPSQQPAARRVASSSRASSVSPPPPQQQRSTSTAAAVDIESVPLKPLGHAEPNFAKATFDDGAGIFAVQGDDVPKLTCSICSRQFAPDRIDAHRKICAKSRESEKRRRVFDLKQVRVEGMLEQNQASDPTLKSRALEGSPDKETERKLEQIKKRKPSWRQQSAQLQKAMRSARRQSGDDADGVMILEDEEEEVDHRVLCNGCGRRFAPDTAERHIPKCVEKSRGGR